MPHEDQTVAGDSHDRSREWCSRNVRGSASLQFGAAPPADKLRFRVVGDEPISGAAARTIVTGWKAIVLKDMVSGQCYVTFISGNVMSTSGPGACQ